MPSPLLRPPSPRLTAPGREPRARRLGKVVLRAYLRAWHGLEIRGREHLPPRGPALALTNHASLLDVPALLALDPYPDTAMIAKASLLGLPGLRWLLRQWGAIPVERKGRDTAGIRALLAALREGRVVAVAAEGRRSRSGRLEPINPVVARLATTADVPLIPVGIGGSFAALPPGARFPRRRKIVVRVGKPFRLPRAAPPEEAARRIRDEIAALLPADQQPRV